VRINQDGSTDVSEAGIADVADYEAGAFTEAQVLEWVKLRKHSNLACAIYVAASNRTSLTSALQEAGHTGVDLWVADWSLSEAEAVNLLTTSGDYPVVAVQWASPASNPDTLVPGSAKTLAEANVDLSIAVASWFAHSS
jgi:hypothetical protein